MDKKPNKTSKKVKKTSSKKITSVQKCPLEEGFKETLTNQQEQFFELKERFDKMNGAIPFIKESTQRIEQMIIKVDTKIDDLYQYNRLQDGKIHTNQIEIAKNNKVIQWIERGVIMVATAAAVTAVINLFIQKIF